MDSEPMAAVALVGGYRRADVDSRRNEADGATKHRDLPTPFLSVAAVV